MYCKHCYKMIDDGSDFCKYCGKPQGAPPKKPIYKRWWLWAIVAIIAIGIIGGAREEAPAAQSSVSASAQTDIDDISTYPNLVDETFAINTVDDNRTVGEKNALRSAKSYLDTLAFSYSGLISQLEYEGFTTAEATYAAKHCGADWKEQALKSANSYLRTSAFSYSGLMDQLEYEGFTLIEATYGVENCGADWFEQAAKCAASYIKHSAFSRQGLIDQLLFEGFTQQQAEYGARSVGY